MPSISTCLCLFINVWCDVEQNAACSVSIAILWMSALHLAFNICARHIKSRYGLSLTWFKQNFWISTKISNAVIIGSICDHHGHHLFSLIAIISIALFILSFIIYPTNLQNGMISIWIININICDKTFVNVTQNRQNVGGH